MHTAKEKGEDKNVADAHDKEVASTRVSIKQHDKEQVGKHGCKEPSRK